MHIRDLALLVQLSAFGCLAAACNRTSVPIATATQPVVCDPAPKLDNFRSVGDSLLRLDDTTQVMYAVGRQLRRDYRCAGLLFNAIVMCNDVHSQPCDPALRRDPNDPTRAPNVTSMPRVVAHAMEAAGGRPCFPRSCSAEGALFLFDLETPTFHGDTALVGVTVFPAASKSARTRFVRYVYRATRSSPFLYEVTARFLESTGHYRSKD
jgi:hypothetical protein